MASAAVILRSCLVGLDELFGRVKIAGWQGDVRRVLASADPRAMGTAYERMSGGSASGTFHDLIISELNRHPVSERQEPWINELLTTFQAMAEVAMRAIVLDGATASLPVSPSVAARRIPGMGGVGLDRIDRRQVTVYALDCRACGSRYLLNTAVDDAAAKRWAVAIAPSFVAANRCQELVGRALEAGKDPDTRRAIAEVRPVADALGLPTIRLPYNRPGGGPNDRCAVCGADQWWPVALRLVENPLRFVAPA